MNVRVPPHSEQAEQSVIGGLLIENVAWAKVGSVLRESDFYLRSHQLIFRAIRRLIDDSRPADVVTVADFLTQKEVINECGGLAYLATLARDTPSAYNIASYAEIVRERALRRQMVSLSSLIQDMAFNDVESDAYALLSKAENLVFKLRQNLAFNKGGFVKLKQALADTVDSIEHNFTNPPVNGVVGISSGYRSIDEVLSGFSSGLYVLAGRPSMGKTSLAMNFVENSAVSGRSVAVFSLEMPVEQLAKRMLAGSAGLPLRLMRESWSIQDHEWPLLSTGMLRIADLPIWIDDAGGQTVSDIRAKCLRLNAEIAQEGENKRLGMIVIDYLQLLDGDGSSAMSANDRISQISRGLKLLSKDLDVPVIVLSQLNRKVEERGNKRPINADLRDSGAIEQDADVIMMVYRDEVYNPDTPDKGVAELIVTKHRNGPLGLVRLLFDGYLTRFREFEHGFD